ncbi:MAG: aldo/keto reductase [Lachnospira pectinoschiza]
MGLGTWFIDDSKVADAVKAAVKLGYRHIDTAQAYGNERAVGRAIKIVELTEKIYFYQQKYGLVNLKTLY